VYTFLISFTGLRATCPNPFLIDLITVIAKEQNDEYFLSCSVDIVTRLQALGRMDSVSIPCRFKNSFCYHSPSYPVGIFGFHSAPAKRLWPQGGSLVCNANFRITWNCASTYPYVFTACFSVKCGDNYTVILCSDIILLTTFWSAFLIVSFLKTIQCYILLLESKTK
jgi:hypothetical protein